MHRVHCEISIPLFSSLGVQFAAGSALNYRLDFQIPKRQLLAFCYTRKVSNNFCLTACLFYVFRENTKNYTLQHALLLISITDIPFFAVVYVGTQFTTGPQTHLANNCFAFAPEHFPESCVDRRSQCEPRHLPIRAISSEKQSCYLFYDNRSDEDSTDSKYDIQPILAGQAEMLRPYQNCCYIPCKALHISNLCICRIPRAVCI